MSEGSKKTARKDSGITPAIDLIRSPAGPHAAIPLSPSASSSSSSQGQVNAGAVRATLPNIDAIVEQPPRRRSSIMASGTIGNDMPRIGKVLETKEPQERENRFIAKCRGCCIVYDMSDPTRDLSQKEIKRNTLQELCDVLRSVRGMLTEPIYPEVINLVAVNAFRALPPLNPNIIPEFDPVAEAEEPTMEVAWPHLQLVYNVFLGMLESPDFNAQLAVKFIDHTFVLQLLQLFDSEDPRERDLLKAIVHRMYGKFLMLRTYIRKQFNNIFYRVIYEVGRHHGLAEILEILGSIINGFAVPLREEHRLFLFKILIPLHKVAGLVQFHPQLAYCTVQYLEKDPSLSADLITHFLRLWPKTDGAKEVMFLNELEELLDVMEPEQFPKIMIPVFKQLALSAASPHFQIAERSMFFFGNDYILGLLRNQSVVLFPILYPTLYKISTGHWNKSIHSLAYYTLKVMMDMDPRNFDLCIVNHSTKLTEEKEMAEKRRHFEFMQKIHKAAQKSPFYKQIAPNLHIRQPDFDDYTDRRSVSMKYENWRVTTDELRSRESQTAILRPNSDRNDVRKRSLSTQPPASAQQASPPQPDGANQKNVTGSKSVNISSVNSPNVNNATALVQQALQRAAQNKGLVAPVVSTILSQNSVKTTLSMARKNSGPDKTRK